MKETHKTIRRFRPYAILLGLAAMLNFLIAWACALWSPYTIHTRPSEERIDGGYPAMITGSYDKQGYWRTSRGFGVTQVVPIGARGAEGQFVYWRGTHTPAYYRSGWPMLALQSTVTFQDYKARWDLPLGEIIHRGMQTRWLPKWIHAAEDRRLAIVPSVPGFAVNTLVYFTILTGVRLLWLRVKKQLKF